MTVAEPDPRVIATLDILGTGYEVLACDPELADTAAFCAAYDVPLEHSANTIVVASRRPEGHHVACVLLATTRLDVNGLIRRRMDVKKASFARPEETAALTNMMIGGVTPFALPEDLAVWVDSAVMDLDWVILGAGSRSAKIKVDPRAMLLLPSVEVVPDLAMPVTASVEDA
ncbi:MAG TPA: YbaK/EbsC family protein [Acidimicrobiia bacterium]|nr:YbaK/EbsC family protein [Acidimicrobiia bacterium]